MPVEETPEDDTVRQSYNFAPGYHGLVYRADGPDFGSGKAENKHDGDNREPGKTVDETVALAKGHVDPTKYKLQAMKWGMFADIGCVAGGGMTVLTFYVTLQVLYHSGRSATRSMVL